MLLIDLVPQPEVIQYRVLFFLTFSSRDGWHGIAFVAILPLIYSGIASSATPQRIIEGYFGFLILQKEHRPHIHNAQFIKLYGQADGAEQPLLFLQGNHQDTPLDMLPESDPRIGNYLDVIHHRWGNGVELLRCDCLITNIDQVILLAVDHQLIAMHLYARYKPQHLRHGFALSNRIAFEPNPYIAVRLQLGVLSNHLHFR